MSDLNSVRDLATTATKARHLVTLENQMHDLKLALTSQRNLFDEPTLEERELLEMASNCLESALSNLNKLPKR